MATKGLGRGLEALLVDVPNELGFSTSNEFVEHKKLYERKRLYQERMQLQQEAEQLKQLLDTFEQLVLQLDILQNQTL